MGHAVKFNANLRIPRRAPSHDSSRMLALSTALRPGIYMLIGVFFAVSAFPELRRGSRLRSRSSNKEMRVWRAAFLTVACCFFVRGAIALLP